MTTAYTSLLGLALPVTGELSGTWGDTVNNSITSLLDSAIAGTTTLSADTTLTTTTGASNQARQAILLCTGQVANITITAPAQSKIYTVINASATYTVKIRGVGPTTGITIPVSSTATVAWNGSDFVDASGYINGNLKVNGTLSVTGAVTFTAGTASTTTGTGTLVITGGLGVSGRINAANFDGIVGANTAAAGSFTTLSATGVATFSAGTAALPAITTTGDTNTGIWFPAADTIAFTEGGVESMRIDSSGNLGLGVTPSAWVSNIKAIQIGAQGAVSYFTSNNGVNLTNNFYYNGSANIYIATGYASTYLQTAGQHQWSTAPYGTAGNSVSLTQAMTLDASGNLGIGTTSPSAKLHLSSTGSTAQIITSTGAANYASISLTNTTTGYGYDVGFGGSTSLAPNSFYVYGGSTASMKMLIDSSGNLLVGTTDNSNLASAQGLYLRGTGADNCLYGLNNATTNDGVSLALFYSSFSTANQTKFEVKSDGDVFSRTNSYGGFSDVRLKQGITPASSQWSDIKNIEVVKFQMKSEQFSDAENPWMLGVIAQQVEQVSPGLVDEDVKDGIKTVKYSILYMKAVKALQEAMERIEQLETRITALEGA